MKFISIRVPRTAWFAGAIVAAALALGAMLVHRHTVTAAHAAAPSPATAAMRVAIDPETGQIGLPSSEDAKALAMPAEPQGEAPVRVLADGTTQIDMRGRGLTYAVARVGADGKVATGCATDANDARRFLLGAGTATKAVDGGEVK